MDFRNQFPILTKEINGHPLVYLDNAATSQKPRAVIEAISDYYRGHNANVHRGIHQLAVEATNLWVDAHAATADFINADGIEEIIFTRNATEGINLVANSYGRQMLQEGDVLVITEMEHHSNILPWQALAREKKLKLEWLPVLEDFSLDLSYLEFLIRKYKERIKIVSLVHLSNVLGVVNDIAPLIKSAKSVGAVVLLDCAQSVVHMPIDVKKLDCDFAVFSAHKMYGPTGIGVVYGRRELLEKLEPWQYGGEMIKSVRKTGAEWNDLPWKFEAGTPDIAGGAGLLAAIRWIQENIDWEKLNKHEKELMSIAVAGLKAIQGVKIFGPDDPNIRKGVIAFNVEGIHPHDLASLLDEKGIAIRAGYHCAEPLHKRFEVGPTARISFAAYNTADEVRYFIEALKDRIKTFKSG